MKGRHARKLTGIGLPGLEPERKTAEKYPRPTLGGGFPVSAGPGIDPARLQTVDRLAVACPTGKMLLIVTCFAF